MVSYQKGNGNYQTKKTVFCDSLNLRVKIKIPFALVYISFDSPYLVEVGHGQVLLLPVGRMNLE